MAARSSKAQLERFDPPTSDQDDSSLSWATQASPTIRVINASGIGDAGSAIDLVRSQHVVLINCAGLEQRLAQRLNDMVCGGLTALGGQLHSISPTLLLACPTLSRVHTI